MRVILTSFGTTGDNAPFIAIAEALREQGDDPLLLLNPLHEEAARARGLPFVALGTCWSPDDVTDYAKYASLIRGPAAIWRDFYLPRVLPTFHAVRQAISQHRAEAVVGHWLSFGSHLAARQAGIPNVVVSLAPCWWYSRKDPSAYVSLAGPAWLRRIGVAGARLLADRIVSASLRSVCRALDLPWRPDEHFAVFREAHANLGLWSPALRPVAEDDPPRATICGFPWLFSAGAQLGREVEQFLDAGPSPLVVGLGSSAIRWGAQLYGEIGRVCRELGCRVVLTGARPDAAAGLEGALAVPFAPYRLVFPHARAIIHHGGIGTLAEAMRAGRPVAIVPFVNDQHDNARRASTSGGARLWSRSQTRRKRLSKAVAGLLSDEALAKTAASLGARISAEPNGAAVAARIITGRSALP